MFKVTFSMAHTNGAAHIIIRFENPKPKAMEERECNGNKIEKIIEIEDKIITVGDASGTQSSLISTTSSNLVV